MFESGENTFILVSPLSVSDTLAFFLRDKGNVLTVCHNKLVCLTLKIYFLSLTFRLAFSLEVEGMQEITILVQ